MANNFSIPGWVFEHRKTVCFQCLNYYICVDKLNIAKQEFVCRLDKIKPIQELVAEKAWPNSIDRVSGCCDSALNY